MAYSLIDLVTLVQQGQLDYFVELWKRCWKYGLSLMQRETAYVKTTKAGKKEKSFLPGLPKDIARELLRDVQVMVLEHIRASSFQADEDFLGWLRTIAINRKIEYLRERREIPISSMGQVSWQEDNCEQSEPLVNTIPDSRTMAPPDILSEKEKQTARGRFFELIPKLLSKLDPLEDFIIHQKIYQNKTVPERLSRF